MPATFVVGRGRAVGARVGATVVGGVCEGLGDGVSGVLFCVASVAEAEVGLRREDSLFVRGEEEETPSEIIGLHLVDGGGGCPEIGHDRASIAHLPRRPGVQTRQKRRHGPPGGEALGVFHQADGIGRAAVPVGDDALMGPDPGSQIVAVGQFRAQPRRAGVGLRSSSAAEVLGRFRQ